MDTNDAMKFGRRQEVRQILIFLLANALPLLLVLYGLKCIIMLSGELAAPPDVTRYHIIGSFRLLPVRGASAVMAGLGDILFGLFGYLSCGWPPNEDRSWIWRLMRGMLRWGSVLSAFWFWYRAGKLRAGAP